MCLVLSISPDFSLSRSPGSHPSPQADNSYSSGAKNPVFDPIAIERIALPEQPPERSIGPESGMVFEQRVQAGDPSRSERDKTEQEEDIDQMTGE